MIQDAAEDRAIVEAIEAQNAREESHFDPGATDADHQPWGGTFDEKRPGDNRHLKI